jgi:hypothetical protein
MMRFRLSLRRLHSPDRCLPGCWSLLPNAGEASRFHSRLASATFALVQPSTELVVIASRSIDQTGR